MSKTSSKSSGFQLSQISSTARILIVDTSVLMYDPHAIESFEDNVVVLSPKSINELESLAANSSQRIAYSANSAIRVLSDYESMGDLRNGVPVNDGFLVMDDNGNDWEGLPKAIEQTKTNILLAVANHWKTKMESCRYDGVKPRVSVVTQNMSLRFLANSCGISAESYQHDRLINRMKDLYTGLVQVDLQEEEQSLLYDFIHNGSLNPRQLPKSLNELGLISNQFVRLVTGKDQIAYGIYKADRDMIIHVKPQDKKLKIIPLNPEQSCADNLLYDAGIILVTIVGVAGTGKTFLSLNAGLDQIRNGVYKKLIVFRPTVEIGRDMGFLKGDLSEKMAPWRGPIEEAIRRIYSLQGKDEDVRDILTKMTTDGTFEVRPINYERGDSIHNAFVMVEEGQNLPPPFLKMLITRIAAGSKIVINGDLTQIDDPYLDFGSSGLTKVVEKFKGLKLGNEGTIGHITLIKSERSAIAEMAARIL